MGHLTRKSKKSTALTIDTEDSQAPFNMTVETTIQRMFDRYPDLFSTRKECLNHLFCVIGNGYEWKRGQIVECGEDDEVEPFIIEEEKKDYEVKHPKAEPSKENIQKWNERKALYPMCYEFKWYPVCEFSLINEIPDDARPDWKEAVEECKKMLKKDGIEV